MVKMVKIGSDGNIINADYEYEDCANNDSHDERPEVSVYLVCKRRDVVVTLFVNDTTKKSKR
jgi:hypothetical protein